MFDQCLTVFERGAGLPGMRLACSLASMLTIATCCYSARAVALRRSGDVTHEARARAVACSTTGKVPGICSLLCMALIIHPVHT
jgi:hypothetical protein